MEQDTNLFIILHVTHIDKRHKSHKRNKMKQKCYYVIKNKINTKTTNIVINNDENEELISCLYELNGERWTC